MPPDETAPAETATLTPDWSPRRIARIAALTGAATYLEIGVEYGQTFFCVEIAAKDAVDPKFRFDTADRAGPSVRFFAETSDSGPRIIRSH